MNNQDGMYYRNRETIKNMNSCRRYKSMLSYSSCTEDKVQKTIAVDRNVDFKYEKPKTAAGKAKTTENYGCATCGGGGYKEMEAENYYGSCTGCGSVGGKCITSLRRNGTWKCATDQMGRCGRFCMT